MSEQYRSNNQKPTGRTRGVIQLTRRQSEELHLRLSTVEKDFELVAPNQCQDLHSDKFTKEGLLLDEELFCKGKFRFYINGYGWAMSSLDMHTHMRKGFLPDSFEFYQSKPYGGKIFLIGLVDECKTYGQRFSAMQVRIATIGNELSVLTNFICLQASNQTYCPNRDPRYPLRPCSDSCNCKKTVVYDVHELNFISLQKVSNFKANTAFVNSS